MLSQRRLYFSSACIATIGLEPRQLSCKFAAAKDVPQRRRYTVRPIDGCDGVIAVELSLRPPARLVGHAEGVESNHAEPAGIEPATAVAAYRQIPQF